MTWMQAKIEALRLVEELAELRRTLHEMGFGKRAIAAAAVAAGVQEVAA